MNNQERFNKFINAVPKWSKDVVDEIEKEWLDPEYNYINTYIEGEDDIASAGMTLGEQGFSDTASSLLAVHHQQPQQAIFFMQRSRRRRAYSLLIALLFARKIGNKPDLLESPCIELMTTVAMGYPMLAKKMLTQLLDALENGYGVNNGIDMVNMYNYRYPAMCLSLLCDWTQLAPPKLDDWGLERDARWSPLLHHWKSNDLKLVEEALLTAADMHITESAVTNREVDKNNDFSFGSPYEDSYPAEILAVLRIRESMELENPVLDHPLMKTPYAQITHSFVEPEIYPDDEIFTMLINEMKIKDPEMLAEIEDL